MATPSTHSYWWVQWRNSMISTTDLILLMLLGSHMMALRLLWECTRGMNGMKRGIPEHLSVMDENMAEVIRIGSDLCDTVEALTAVSEAAGTASIAAGSGEAQPFDIGNTILSLIASRMMGPSDGGSQVQDGPQEGTVYAESEETKN